jgi:hypothetical protein
MPQAEVFAIDLVKVAFATRLPTRASYIGDVAPSAAARARVAALPRTIALEGQWLFEKNSHGMARA